MHVGRLRRRSGASSLGRCTTLSTRSSTLFRTTWQSRRGMAIWLKYFLLNKKNYDPRRKLSIGEQQRRLRAMLFTGYAIGMVFLMIPGFRFFQSPQEFDHFFERNAMKQSVNVLDCGVQMQVIEKGVGPTPVSPDTPVRVHMIGETLDGRVFTNTERRVKPLTLTANSVVSGFGEALMRMRVAGEYNVWVPAALAYGRAGKAGSVPPNTPVLFRVQVVGIDSGGLKKKQLVL